MPLDNPLPYAHLRSWLLARKITPLPNYELTDTEVTHDYALSFLVDKYEKVESLSLVLRECLEKNLISPDSSHDSSGFNIWYLIISFSDIPFWIKQMSTSITCPISQCNIEVPVLANDGHTYESEDIKEWLRTSGTSPLTSNKMSLYLEDNTPLINAFWRYFDPDSVEYSEDEQVWSVAFYKISYDTVSSDPESYAAEIYDDGNYDFL